MCPAVWLLLNGAKGVFIIAVANCIVEEEITTRSRSRSPFEFQISISNLNERYNDGQTNVDSAF